MPNKKEGSLRSLFMLSYLVFIVQVTFKDKYEIEDHSNNMVIESYLQTLDNDAQK